MTLVNEEKALLKGKMAQEDLLDYLVRMQNNPHALRSGRTTQQ